MFAPFQLHGQRQIDGHVTIDEEFDQLPNHGRVVDLHPRQDVVNRDDRPELKDEIVGKDLKEKKCNVGLGRSVGWAPAGLTYVFAKGVSDQVRDPLTPRNSFQ